MRLIFEVRLADGDSDTVNDGDGGEARGGKRHPSSSSSSSSSVVVAIVIGSAASAFRQDGKCHHRDQHERVLSRPV